MEVANRQQISPKGERRRNKHVILRSAAGVGVVLLVMLVILQEILPVNEPDSMPGDNWPTDCPWCGGGCQYQQPTHVPAESRWMQHWTDEGQPGVVFSGEVIPPAPDVSVPGGDAPPQNETPDNAGLDTGGDTAQPQAPAMPDVAAGGQAAAGGGNDAAVDGVMTWLQDTTTKVKELWQGDIGWMATKLWAILAGVVLLLAIIASVVIKRVRRARHKKDG